MGAQGLPSPSAAGHLSRVVVLGHRGASAVRPENTLDAFLAAARMGADGVELDVRRSADGALVVHHDPVIPGRGPVADLTVSDLPPTVALLDAVLDACDGMIVNVEVKSQPGEPGFDPGRLLAREVAALVAERRLLATVVVSSFDLEALDVARSAEPGLVTGLLVIPGADPARAAEVASARGHRALHPHHLAVDADLVARAHDRGLAVTAWTVDDPDRVRWLAGVGVDGVITNRPDVALAALGRA